MTDSRNPVNRVAPADYVSIPGGRNMYWPAGVTLLQNALLMAFWLALPLLACISAAGMVGGIVQGSLGHSDPATLVAAKLLAGGAALVFFGAWMLMFMAGYWSSLWPGVTQLVR